MPTVGTFKVGHRVKTPGGLYGTVTAVKGAMVNVEYDDPREGRVSFHANALRLEKNA